MADGFERGFQSVNRMLPGPSIQVCQGDIVVVDVNNQMDGTATTIHWHGFRQKGTPFYDGVPFLTQCPIIYGTSFRYMFYANDLGTHFWHSHSGLHKANGIYGPLIVRNDEDNQKLYDYDPENFIILVADWMHVPAENYFPGLGRLSLNFILKTFIIND
jgi:FtsP/CotA-like multicopper oxidase with cupredoxin domain